MHHLSHILLRLMNSDNFMKYIFGVDTRSSVACERDRNGQLFFTLTHTQTHLSEPGFKLEIRHVEGC